MSKINLIFINVLIFTKLNFNGIEILYSSKLSFVKYI